MNMPILTQLDYKTLLRCICMCCFLFLAACASTPSSDQGVERESASRTRSSNTVSQLLRRAESARGSAAAGYALQAAELLYEQAQGEEAANVLASIDMSGLEPELAADILLFRAELAQDDNQPRTVLNLLQPGSFPALGNMDASHQVRYHRLRAQAYYSIEAILSSALERIQMDRLLSDEALKNNHELIWEVLGTLPLSQLQALAATAINYEVRGWYELALIAREYTNDLDRQLVELRRWRTGWTRHLAALVLPTEMDQVEIMARERPRQIALLLPLNQPAGIIVRDAFMSAYFNLLELGGQVPRIRLYNSSEYQDILALHQQAIDDGAELIIGPLLKDQVAILQTVPDLGVPTLALNNVDGSTPASPLLYQFSLSPEDEARQLADKAWRDGHRRVAILHPVDELSLRKLDSFVAAWSSLGGQVVGQEAFRENYTETISRLLELDHSNERHEQLNRLLGKSTVFQPRRRQDIDFIYLVAQPAPARQIVPSLSYLYAGNIPVYATQDVYSGLPKPVDDRDLNGVKFGESPWLLGQDDSSVSRTRELFTQTNAQALRLQAFGIDAFRLYPRLRLLSTNANTVIPGASGILRLGPNQNIVRELTWTSIKDGLAVIDK